MSSAAFPPIVGAMLHTNPYPPIFLKFPARDLAKSPHRKIRFRQKDSVFIKISVIVGHGYLILYA